MGDIFACCICNRLCSPMSFTWDASTMSPVLQVMPFQVQSCFVIWWRIAHSWCILPSTQAPRCRGGQQCI